jgi:predicted CoA-binding protein
VGGAVMQMLRQAGYGRRVMPVNPKGGTISGYDSVTLIATIDPPVELAATARLPMLHCMMGPYPPRRNGLLPWRQ